MARRRLEATSNAGSDWRMWGGFKIEPAGYRSDLVHLHRPQGWSIPRGRLIRDAAGNLYGTATQSGRTGRSCFQVGCGVVFMLNPAGQETILHTFTGPPDGQTPMGSLVQYALGMLYGTTDKLAPKAAPIQIGIRMRYCLQTRPDWPRDYFVLLYPGSRWRKPSIWAAPGCCWEFVRHHHQRKRQLVLSAWQYHWMWGRLQSGPKWQQDCPVYLPRRCGRCGPLLPAWFLATRSQRLIAPVTTRSSCT